MARRINSPVYSAEWHPGLAEDADRLESLADRWRLVAVGFAALSVGIGLAWALSGSGPGGRDDGASIELSRLQARMAVVELANERVRHLEERVRAVTQIGDAGPGGIGPVDEVELAAAGDGAGRLRDTSPAARETLKEMLELGEPDALDRRIDDLLADARAQERDLTGLYEALRDQRDAMTRTPSVWPVRGWVTSRFGHRVSDFTGRSQFHEGIDIAGPVGTAVRATADGVVVEAGWRGGYGLLVVVDHGLGVTTLYGHLRRVAVRVGERVRRGATVGQLGATGRATGPHLHYEVRRNGVPENPARYIFD